MCFEAGLDHLVHTKPVQLVIGHCELLKLLKVGAEQSRICAWTYASQQIVQVNAGFVVLGSQDSAAQGTDPGISK